MVEVAQADGAVELVLVSNFCRLRREFHGIVLDVFNLRFLNVRLDSYGVLRSFLILLRTNGLKNALLLLDVLCVTVNHHLHLLRNGFQLSLDRLFLFIAKASEPGEAADTFFVRL